MISIAFISFRESLEVLMVGGAILTSLSQLKIHKRRDFFLGGTVGLLFSLVLFVLFSFAGSKINFNISGEMGEILEYLNYLGSGIFLFITAILLHNKMKHIVSQAPTLLLDTSLFAVGFLLVLREGLEIVAFSLSTSITSSFISSLMGFVVGIAATMIIGVLGIRFASVHLSQKRLLVVVDWGIKLLALYFVIKGIAGLSEFVL